MMRLISLLAATGFMATIAQAEPLTLVTEHYPPFNYREGSEIRGASVDQIDRMMKDAGIDYRLDMMPWARALAMAEDQAGFCVFTTVHNEERDKTFKWVEPLLVGRTILIRKQATGVNPASLAEARAYVIGTQRGDFTQDILQKLEFPRIDLATDLDLTLKKLLLGRIDLMPISEKYYDKLKREVQPIEKVLLLAEQVYSLACNRSVPDSRIRRMQASLDALIADGTQARLFAKYGLEAGD